MGRTGHRFSISVLAAVAIVAGCVTVNVFFPAAEVEKTADEIVARINELCFEWLDAPVRRVAAHDVPLPYAPPLEDFVLPQTSDIVRASRWLAAY